MCDTGAFCHDGVRFPHSPVCLDAIRFRPARSQSPFPPLIRFPPSVRLTLCGLSQFVKSSRAFKILGDTMSHRGNGSTDSEYVNGHRESHFGGFAPIESQKVNVCSHHSHSKEENEDGHT